MRDAHFTRIELDGAVKHDNGQQFVSGRGFAGDAFEDIHRIEPHGFASHPVKGGIGHLILPRGARDSAYVIGGENPAMRPEIGAGGTAIYDAHGGVISIVNKAVRVVGATTIVGDVHIDGNLTCSGSITDADGNNGA